MVRFHDQKHPLFSCFAVVTEGDKKVAFEAGEQGHFGKPFDPEELTATLRAAVNINLPRSTLFPLGLYLTDASITPIHFSEHRLLAISHSGFFTLI
jgi:DNA-binding response OmpR family regulator